MKTSIIRIATLFFLTLVAFHFNSCKKENTRTNNSGSIVFWQTKSTSDKYKGQYPNYNYYLKGVYYSNTNSSIYWNIAPDCGASGAFTFNYILGEKSEETMQLQIRGDHNEIIIDGFITLKNGICSNFEIK